MKKIWVLRLAWLVLPIVAGTALTDYVHTSLNSGNFGLVLLSVGWFAGLLTVLVPHPLSLTLLRLSVSALGCLVTLATTQALSMPTVALTLLIAPLAFSSDFGEATVNGISYPNEKRFLLRVPGPLLFGPLVLVGGVLIAAFFGSVLLVAHHTLLGVGAFAISLAFGVIAVGRLHVLSRRWVVFVPNGIVLHDPLSLADPTLFLREVTERMQLATRTSADLDLTQSALGNAVRMDFKETIPVILRKQAASDAQEIQSLIFSPTRPGKVLEEASRRKMLG